MRKICAVTGTRAEFGILYCLLKGIQADKDLELQLIVTGTHLEKEFGYTITEIEKEFSINQKIPLELSDDTTLGISKSMALATLGFTKTFEELQPDLLILLGDRYEIFCAASSALISQIPVAHIHGGELTQGAYDDAFRHSITKMSHLHFTSTDEYSNRVIQMGEQPNKVFNVGALGIENIKRLPLLDKKKFQNSINFTLGNKNILVTFHPETLGTKSSKEQFQELLEVLDTLEDTKIIFTKSNADTDGKIINAMIDDYVKTRKNTISFDSLGQLRYLSCLQYMDCVIGNSSSGILEAPSFKIGTINIGSRQKGRIKAESVIDVDCDKKSILHGLKTLYSKDFQKKLENCVNPYNSDHTSKKIVNILKKINLEDLVQKSFYTIN
jgi:GDP/UDP-N,N'-diacetylbacillosamine 2-epimerase (hydrolysing)